MDNLVAWVLGSDGQFLDPESILRIFIFALIVGLIGDMAKAIANGANL